jgi:hypothetical protein
MKAAHHMHFGDPKLKRLARRLDDFGDSHFEGVRVAFSSTKCAKLAREKANVGVIDVPIEDVGGAVPVFAFPHDVGDEPERIDVGGAIESRSFVLVDPLSGDDLIADRAQFLRNEADACEIFHKFNLTQDHSFIKLATNFLISKATFGVAPCCRGYDESCPSNVRSFYAAS